MVTQLLIGLGTGLLLAFLAHRLGYSSGSGPFVLGATVAIPFWAGGWVWGLGPAFFFLSAMLWTRYRAADKRRLLAQVDSDAPPDGIIARVGWPVILAVLYACIAHHRVLFPAFVGALATATGDVWATQLGVLSPVQPRLPIARPRVKAGTPGAISALGLVATLVGAWSQGLVGLLGISLRAWMNQLPRDPEVFFLPLAAMLGGLAGTFTDSFLGATAQGLYYCEHCQTYSEERIHTCGQPAQQVRGWPWLTNEGVDFVSTLVGAAVTAVLVTWLAGL